MEGSPSIVDSLPKRDWRATFGSLVISDQRGEQVSTRLPSVESFRVLAILAVILWHTGFVSSLSQLVNDNFLIVLTGYLVWWVGVPYFLITAGYFFRRSVMAEGNPVVAFRRYVFPLAWLLFVWMCIYILIPDSWPAQILHRGLWQPSISEALKNIHLLESQHIHLFLDGQRPVWHLWFLPALMFSLAALTLMAVYRLESCVIPLIIGLYVLALTEEIAGGSFLNSSVYLGLWMVACLITAIGWWLAGRERFSVAMACSLIVGGYVLALMEGTVMDVVLHSSRQAIRGHYFLGGIVLSTGIFVFALAKPRLGQSTPFPFLAQFTLGVYLSHIFVIYTLRPIIWKLGNVIPLQAVLVAIVVYALSVLFTAAVVRIPIVKYLVVKPIRKGGTKQLKRQTQTTKETD
ncbi:MAG: acyltransferase [Nitrospira sp.]|nr:acyltransferase [Nitrospira sp.]